MASKTSKSPKIAVLGAGSWGTTLTWLLASNERCVSIWSRDREKLDRLRELRRIERPLSIGIPEDVEICADLEQCVDEAAVILFCCTAQTMRKVAQQVAQAHGSRVGAGGGRASKPQSAVLVSAAKGLELDTFERMTQILSDVLPGYKTCALSGPNLAVEVLQGLPTASVVACDDEDTARYVQQQLSVRTFRVYTNTDVVGVEIGGALKNIIAIAAGAVDGLELGTNAKAALMSRGLAEMVRFATAVGARPTTLSGLAGMGDLVATCYSSLSRNYRLGYHMARGESREKVEQELGAVAEGATTARAVVESSKKLGIQMPIAEQVDSTLSGHTTPEKAIMTLMARPLASE